MAHKSASLQLQHLPIEVIELIIHWLPLFKDKFRLASVCRVTNLYKRIILGWCMAEWDQQESAPTIYKAAARGQIDLLQWWHQSDIPDYCIFGAESSIEEETIEALTKASNDGNIEVLNWWSKHLKVYKSPKAIESALAKGDILVLDWWKDKGLCWESETSGYIVAARTGQIDVLNWWKENWRFKPSSEDISQGIWMSCVKGQIDILNWWTDNKYYSKQGRFSVLKVARECPVSTLYWLQTNAQEFLWDADTVDLLCQGGHLETLDWIFKQDFKLEWSTKSMDYASEHGHVKVLEWWKASGRELKYSRFAMDFASANGHVKVLDWWLASQLELNYTSEALFSAIIFNHVETLIWWCDSGLSLSWPQRTDFPEGCVPEWARKYYVEPAPVYVNPGASLLPAPLSGRRSKASRTLAQSLRDKSVESLSDDESGEPQSEDYKAPQTQSQSLKDKSVVLSRKEDKSAQPSSEDFYEFSATVVESIQNLSFTERTRDAPDGLFTSGKAERPSQSSPTRQLKPKLQLKPKNGSPFKSKLSSR